MTTTKKNKSLFFVKNKQVLERIDVHLIRYIHAEGNFCFFNMKNKESYSIKISLKQLQNHFNQEQFVRIHKGYVINLDYLKQVNIKDKTLLVGDEIIPIGRTYYTDLSNLLSLF